MEETLHQLGGLLLRALPTFLLVLFLTFYLKAVFFKPLGRVLKQRYDATEGARKLAQDSLERAAQRAAEYAAQIRAARAEVYQQQEKIHRQLQDDAAARLAAARREAEKQIDAERGEIAAEVAAARLGLDRDSERLAVQIADSILGRSAA
jgi:F-type H+-transporting ATPase subunit b